MPDPNEGSPLTVREVLSERVGLAVDLVHNELPNWEEYLTKSLNDQKFQAHLQSVIGLHLNANLGQQGVMWGASGPQATVIGKGLLKELSAAGQRQLEDSKSYQNLDKSIKTLQDDLMETRPGIWITENKKRLIIFGSGVGLMALAASYQHQKGSLLYSKTINGKEFDLKEFKDAKFLNGGTLKLGVVPEFDPNNGKIGGGLTQHVKLKRLQADHRFDFSFQQGGLTKAESHLVLKMDLPLQTKLTGDAKMDFLATTMQTDLRLDGKFGKHGSWNAGATIDGMQLQKYFVGLGWDGSKMNATLGATFQPQNSPTPWQVDLGLKIPF